MDTTHVHQVRAILEQFASCWRLQQSLSRHVDLHVSRTTYIFICTYMYEKNNTTAFIG